MAGKKLTRRILKKSRKSAHRTLPLRKNITFEEYRRRIRAFESVSLTHPSVVDFGNEALREAFRLWWHPYDMGGDFDSLTKMDEVVSGAFIERQRLDSNPRLRAAMKKLGMKNRRSSKVAPVKVRIVLTYPLAEIRTKTVTIDRRYPGEIFALAHDFYRELYAEDEKGGGKAGPMNGGQGPLLNRGRGPLIWGHDIGDLVFEGAHYIELPRKGGLSGKTDERCVRAWGRSLELQPRSVDGAEGCFLFSIGS